MSTVSLTAVTPAYPFITDRIKGSVYAANDVARTTPIQYQIDNTVNHPTKIWRFTGLEKNDYIFSIDIIDDAGIALDNITILDVTPSDLDAQIGASLEDIERLERMITSDLSGTVDSLTFNPVVPTENTWYRANAGVGTYINFLSATSTPIIVNENDGQVDFIFNTATGFWKKVKAVFNLATIATKSDLLLKLNSEIGKNLLNPDNFTFDIFYFYGQNSTQQSNGTPYLYGMTDFIEAVPEGLSTIDAGITSAALSSYAVFDINKNWIRNGQNSNFAAYQSGDGFVRFIYQTSYDQNFAKTHAVVKGNTYFFEEFTYYAPLIEVKNKIIEFQSVSEKGISDIQNGTPLIHKSIKDFINFEDKNLLENWISYRHDGVSNSWLSSTSFQQVGNGLIHIKFSAEFTRVNTTAGITVFAVGDISDNTTWHAFYSFSTNGEHDITLDPATYGFTNYTFLLSNETVPSNGILKVKYTDLKIVQYINKASTSSITGQNSKQLFESIDEQIVLIKSKGNATVDNVINGTPVIYGSISNILGYQTRNLTDDYIIYNHVDGGNNWLEVPKFVPTGNNLVHIKFNAIFTRTGGTTSGINIFLISDNVSTWEVPFSFSQNGDYDFTFDPAYYNVYKLFENFKLWFANANGASGQSLTVKYTNLKVFEVENEVSGSVLSGTTAKELFHATDVALANITASLIKEPIKRNPNGDGYQISVNASGNLVAIPVVPSTAAFFGNSLLLGFGYGMAASNNTKDYYYRVTEYIKTLNSSFTASRTLGIDFESITDLSAVDGIVSGMVNPLTGNEQLVVIQLGDNVNSVEKAAVFVVSSYKLSKAVRTKCPNARVIWMGMWYGSTEKYTSIQNACKKTGCSFINIGSILQPSTQNVLGALSRKGREGDRVLNATVTNLVEHTPTNITVTFSISGTSYTATLDVVTYSLSSSTLTYDSEYYIIDSGGVASHPSDEGFRQISNKFLLESGLSDDSEYYK